VLLERLIVHRPHPWGLLITFIELIKNPRYQFWEQPFTHCAPEIERLFESVARSCMPSPSPKGPTGSGGPQPTGPAPVAGGTASAGGVGAGTGGGTGGIATTSPTGSTSASNHNFPLLGTASSPGGSGPRGHGRVPRNTPLGRTSSTTSTASGGSNSQL